MKKFTCLFSSLLFAASALHAKTVTAEGDYSPSPATPNYWGINGVPLQVGNTGTGSVLMADGGEIEVNFASAILGVTATGVGTATVEGIGTRFTAPILTLGAGGKGVMTVSQQGLASSGSAVMGDESTGDGEATVTGAGSIWNVETTFTIGNNGKGKLTLSTGGKTLSDTATLGREAGSYGEIVVTGAGARWETNTNAFLSIWGESKVTVENGGEALIPGVSLGTTAQGVANVLVTGNNSSWSSTNFRLGSTGKGTLTISDGAKVTAVNPLIVAENAGSNGTLNIGAYDLSNPTTAGTLDSSGVEFKSGTGAINFNQIDTTTFAANISGAGSIVQRGNGTTILTGTNPVTGPTTVAAGKLAVNGTLDKSVITVKSGAVLGGTGHLGKIIVEEGGKVSPGNSIGTLNVESFLWEDGAVLEYELGATSSDSINVTEDFTKDGVGAYSFQFINDGWQIGFTYTLVTFGETNFSVGDFSFTNTGGFDGDFVLNGDSLTFTVTSVPEPSTWAMVLASGVVIAVGLRRKRY
jgi:T5SS/PEP-CTERM-associated repeat protein/autotransporter-associated beta strand protein